MPAEKEVTNAELQLQLNHTQTQLEQLQTVNTDQIQRLVRLETQAGSINDQLADITSIKSQLSHYTGAVAGALAVVTVLGGVITWIAQQSISQTINEMRDIKTAVASLQQEMAVLQYRISSDERVKK
jgi:chromosome segregation ATPase